MRPDLSFTLLKKRRKRVVESCGILSLLVLGAPSLKERGKRERKEERKKKNGVFEVNEKLEIQVTTINSETLHKINYSFASEAGM